MIPIQFALRRRMMIGKTARLPKEYQEVEYVQSSGTQYIDTGIGSSHTIVIDVQFINNGSNEQLMGQTPNAGYYFGINKSGYLENGSSQAFSYLGTTRRSISIVGTSSSQTMSVENETKTATRYIVVNNSLMLMGGMPSYPCSAKLYSCQIFVNGVLVRDFVPCYRKSNNAGGLYDLVNSVFYSNAGTGTFAVGSDV